MQTYRLLGNGQPDYLDGPEIVPQKHFYNFLELNCELLQSFLNEWRLVLPLLLHLCHSGTKDLC